MNSVLDPCNEQKDNMLFLYRHVAVGGMIGMEGTNHAINRLTLLVGGVLFFYCLRVNHPVKETNNCIAIVSQLNL